MTYERFFNHCQECGCRIPWRAKAFFGSRGAYARFKQLLESEGVLEKWSKFEADSVEQALRDWCAENDIQCVHTQRAGDGERPD